MTSSHHDNYDPTDFDPSDETDDFSNILQSFQIKKVLGEGVFGKVYQAFSFQQKKEVALKLISKRNFSIESLNSLRYEEFILSQLNHPNLVQFYFVKTIIF